MDSASRRSAHRDEESPDVLCGLSADAVGLDDFKTHKCRLSGQEQSPYVVGAAFFGKPNSLHSYRHVGVQRRTREDAYGLCHDFRSPPVALQLGLPVEELHADVHPCAHSGTRRGPHGPAPCAGRHHVRPRNRLLHSFGRGKQSFGIVTELSHFSASLFGY